MLSQQPLLHHCVNNPTYDIRCSDSYQNATNSVDSVAVEFQSLSVSESMATPYRAAEAMESRMVHYDYPSNESNHDRADSYLATHQHLVND